MVELHKDDQALFVKLLPNKNHSIDLKRSSLMPTSHTSIRVCKIKLIVTCEKIYMIVFLKSRKCA